MSVMRSAQWAAYLSAHPDFFDDFVFQNFTSLQVGENSSKEHTHVCPFVGCSKKYFKLQHAYDRYAARRPFRMAIMSRGRSIML